MVSFTFNCNFYHVSLAQRLTSSKHIVEEPSYKIVFYFINKHKIVTLSIPVSFVNTTYNHSIG